MTASFELEHPLQDRKTLRGWIPLAAPVLLHHFACDSAERMLCLCEKGGHVVDTVLEGSLYKTPLDRRKTNGDRSTRCPACVAFVDVGGGRRRYSA